MRVTKHEKKFINLLTFASGTHLSKEGKASMYKDYLNPSYKSMVRVQWLRTLKGVVNAARIA